MILISAIFVQLHESILTAKMFGFTVAYLHVYLVLYMYMSVVKNAILGDSLSLFLKFCSLCIPFPPTSIAGSWDEHAAIDLPSMVEFALNKSGQKQLYYVGHSQGTTMGFAGFTENKTLAGKIRQFYALAPITTAEYFEGLFKWIADFYKSITVAMVKVAMVKVVITALRIQSWYVWEGWSD